MFAASKSGRAEASDPLFPYVPLLLETTSTNGQQNNTFLDSSTNNFTITRNGTPTQGSVNPYWTNGYWGNYFNGSTDYLNNSSATGINVGSSDFTVEGWVYLNSNSNYSGVFSSFGTAAGNFGVLLGFQNTGVLYGAVGNASGSPAPVEVMSSSAVPINSWNHVAFVRNGTSHKLYLNGVNVGTTTATSSSVGSTTFVVGRYYYNVSNYFLNGYVSNVRLVSSAVYTGAFTPPTTPLTAIANTSLLTCQSNGFKDNSTNNFAITANGTPRVQTFQPFSPPASYTAAAYGGSGYFNGSTDYLNNSSATGINVGASNFTVEGWVYLNSNSNYSGVFSSFGTASGNFGILLGFQNTGVLYGAVGNASGSPAAVDVSSSSAVTTNTWNHVAFVRNGTSHKLYLNGVNVGTTTATSASVGSTTFVEGRYYYNTNSFYLNGYISNVRLVSSAVYTANFTPPTTPLTAISGTQLLTNFTNGGVYDAAVQNNAITVGDAQASTTQSKWPPTSMKFDGTGDWLTAIDGPQLQLGTGDFTIEGWVYLSANGAIYGILSKGAAATGWSVNVTVLNKLQFSYTASNLTGTTSLSASTWYYFSVVRSGSATGNLKLYLNGTLEATSGGAVTDNFNQTDILYVGASRIGATPLNGYLQDVRITKYARTITTPTAAFPTR